jgi:hypothetical protein
MTEPWLADICMEMKYEIVMFGDGYNVQNSIGSLLYDEPLKFQDAYNITRILNGKPA